MSTEIITRRNLPHWYVPGAAHFVTYRLAGTIPAATLHALREDRRRLLDEETEDDSSRHELRARAHKRFFAGYARYLDSHRDIDWLAQPSVAAMVRENLYHHHGRRHYLLAYCILPNHVHVLLQPTDDVDSAGDEPGLGDERPDARGPLASIMHSLKSFTAHEANRLLARSGQFWQHESYDHWVRDDEELARIVDYIAWNPVAPGLVRAPQEWFWSSAHDSFLRDGSPLGLICLP